MINWYLKVVKENYANFNGRARRSEYWYFALVNVIISIVLAIVDSIIGMQLLGGIYSLALLIPSIAVGVRRLHDIGKSGWMLLVALIPLVGAIWLIILFCKEGDSGPNEYGADPKNPYDGIDEIGRPQEY